MDSNCESQYKGVMIVGYCSGCTSLGWNSMIRHLCWSSTV